MIKGKKTYELSTRKLEDVKKRFKPKIRKYRVIHIIKNYFT